MFEAIVCEIPALTLAERSELQALAQLADLSMLTPEDRNRFFELNEKEIACLLGDRCQVLALS